MEESREDMFVVMTLNVKDALNIANSRVTRESLAVVLLTI